MRQIIATSLAHGGHHWPHDFCDQVTAWKRGNGELAAKLEREEWRTLHEEVGKMGI